MPSAGSLTSNGGLRALKHQHTFYPFTSDKGGNLYTKRERREGRAQTTTADNSNNMVLDLRHVGGKQWKAAQQLRCKYGNYIQDLRQLRYCAY